MIFAEAPPFPGALTSPSIHHAFDKGASLAETGAPATPASVGAEEEQASVIGGVALAASKETVGNQFRWGSVPWEHFDIAISAQKGFKLEAGASLMGGALLLCGGKGKIELHGVVDASRRGCPPALGEPLASFGPA